MIRWLVERAAVPVRRGSLAGLVLLLALLSAPAVQAWTYGVSFEGGTLGSIAQGGNGFPGSTGSYTTFTNERVHSGQTACKMIHYVGTDDWGECFGTISLGGSSNWLSEGDEFWFRSYMYFQSPWAWTAQTAPGGGTKILRVRSRDASGGGNFGILSIYARTNVMQGRLTLSNEPCGEQTESSGTLANDTWHCIEYNVKLSSVSGQGHFRIWLDGVLVINDEQSCTWAGPQAFGVDALVMSNWNGSVAQTQTQYLDDILITNETPSSTDAQGHPMIGPTDGQTTDTTPPTGTVVVQNGAAYINDSQVTLQLQATDSGSGMTGGQMRFRNEGGNWSPDFPYATSRSWDLSTGDGTKTVYALYRDAAGNWMSSPVSDSIVLDTTPPAEPENVTVETVP